MHSSSILVATFAATVSANMERMVVPLPRFDVERAIAARQTDSYGSYTDDSYYSDYPTASMDPACESAAATLLAIVSDLPTPPDDLESWAEASATAASGDPCDFSVPASLTSEYSAYSTSVVEWYSSYSSDVADLIAQCTEYDDADTTDFSICTSNDALATGTASGSSGVASVSATTTSSSTKTTGASSSSSSSTKSSSSSSSATSAAATAGAAAREVGIAGAVIAGVLGAVIAL